MSWTNQSVFNAGNEVRAKSFSVIGRGDEDLNTNVVPTQYNVVGINAAKVPAMRDAIRQYVDNIITNIDAVDPLLAADLAFKSEEVQASIKTYITTVKESCASYVSGLLAFSDKLEDVYEAYQANISRVANNYTTITSSIDQKGKYTEQK